MFGEVGLSGEVRAVAMPEQRVAEAKKLGFKTCIMPEVSVKSVDSFFMSIISSFWLGLPKRFFIINSWHDSHPHERACVGFGDYYSDRIQL